MSDNPNTEEAQAAIKAAVMRFQGGDLPGALEFANQMVLDHPDHPVAHNVRGVFLLQSDQIEDALEAFVTATKLRPDYAEAHNNCGVVLDDLLRFDVAVEHFRRALALNPDYAEAHCNLGSALDSLGQWQPALERIRKALSLVPDYDVAALNEANLLRNLGRVDEAKPAYAAILERDPDNLEALAGLAMIHQFASADDPLLQRVERLSHRSDMGPAARARMLFVAGSAWDQIGMPEEAFTRWEKGGTLRKALNAYDPDAVEAEMLLLPTLFGPPPPPDNSQRVAPLFVLGMPRSGTSLIEQMLANHPDVAAAGELDFFEVLVRRTGSDTHAPTADELAAIGDNFRDRLPQFAQGKTIVTDKTPANFLWIGHILHALPEAKILHLKRDARAVCWSVFRNDFGATGRGYPSTQEDLARFWRGYDTMMAAWHVLAPGRIVDIDYQALVDAPEHVARAAFEAVGLPWHAEVLSFEDTKRAVRTVSSQQVRKGIYKGSTEAWRKYEAFLEPLLSGLPSD